MNDITLFHTLDLCYSKLVRPHLTRGVPQRYILGPLLFSIYVCFFTLFLKLFLLT